MKSSGFSLIEITITVAVVGILASIAVPSYQSYLTRTYRTEGQTALVNLAAAMESYYSENHTYATATVAGVVGSTQTSNGYYTLGLTNLTANTHTLTATPNGSHASRDRQCQTLTLTHTGQKSISNGPGGIPTGTAPDCWK